MRLLTLSAALWFAGMSASSAADQTLSEQIRDAVAAGGMPGLHAAIVDHGEDRLAEVYFQGEDEVWGRPLGMQTHGPDTLHDLRSVTKSITGLLYGIALADGLVPPLNAPLYEQFPEYSDLLDGSGRADITIKHVLTMTMGTDWSETLDYTNPTNGEIGMEFSDDRYRFVLEHNVVKTPGSTWAYSGGASALLGGLIARGTGQPIDAFAKERLFAPLGITHFEWSRGQDGVPSSASGLRLTLSDLAKIGYLIVADGEFEGAQIVPKDWLKASFTPHVSIGNGVSYGYQWYILDGTDSDVIFAAGNGGQRLQLSRKAGLIVAAYAGLYNDFESWRTSLAVWVDHAVPAYRQRVAK